MMMMILVDFRLPVTIYCNFFVTTVSEQCVNYRIVNVLEFLLKHLHVHRDVYYMLLLKSSARMYSSVKRTFYKYNVGCWYQRLH
jgi:short subunit fatty acids transporter